MASIPEPKPVVKIGASGDKTQATPNQRAMPKFIQPHVGATIRIGSWEGTVKELNMLPYVESDYTRRFRFDAYENPKLHELRRQHELDQVIAPGKDEFDQQVLLMDWVHNRFQKFGRPTADPRGALEILHDIEQGHTFFCLQYARLLASAAASLGWVNRSLALRRHQDGEGGGASEHSTTEIWSNQYRKWIMLDPTSNMYLEKQGTPLNAVEIRNEWFYGEGRDLVFVVGKKRRKYRKRDLPIFLRQFDRFGDLAIGRDELDKYGFIGYIPNTDFMDAGEDYAGMFIVQDKLCKGTRWHKRTIPEDPAVDPYFPVAQASLRLKVSGRSLEVALQTFCPNFQRFEKQINNGNWEPTADRFCWMVHPGQNRLCVRTVNRFGTRGSVSTIEIGITKKGKDNP